MAPENMGVLENQQKQIKSINTLKGIIDLESKKLREQKMASAHSSLASNLSGTIERP